MNAKFRNTRLGVAVLAATALMCGCGDDTPTSTSVTSTTSVNGAIGVADLLRRGPESPVVVTGSILGDSTSIKLCEAIRAGSTTECTGASVPVVGIEKDTTADSASHDDQWWIESIDLLVHQKSDGRYEVLSFANEEHQIKSPVPVTVRLYSGRQNPTWFLTASEQQHIFDVIGTLTRKEGKVAEANKLGYNGFELGVGDDQLLVFGDKLTIVKATAPQYFEDPSRSVEQALLDAAKSHLEPEEYAALKGAADAS